MSLLKSVSKDELRRLVEQSFSVAEVIKKAGLKPAGANYSAFHRLCKQYEIDCAHFTGQGHLRNKTHDWNKKLPLSEILIEDSTYQSNKLRRRLVEEGVFEHKCSCCGLRKWMEKEIPLELEHKNGIHSDNRIENITLLCPNCHAFTLTYRGRNKKRLRR
jgi:hypothetical protein